MYLLNMMCNNSMILKVIYFIKLIMNIVFIVVPIILIIMVAIDLVQLVFNPNQTIGDKPKAPEHDVRRLVFKRIMYAILIFLIPTIVSLCNNLLGELGVDYVSCYNDAEGDMISSYEEIEAEEEAMEQAYMLAYYEQKAKEEQERTKRRNASRRKVGSSSASSEKEDFVNIALAEEGYAEGYENITKYGEWYGANGRAWCAMFVSWVVNEFNHPELIDVKEAAVPYMIQYFGKKDQFMYSKAGGGDYQPQTGDIIFFQNKSIQISDPKTTDKGTHVGIVVDSDSSHVYTIEGNTSNMVAQKSYSLDDSTVVGYGVW